MASYIEVSSSKLDWAMSFQRTGQFPIDRSDLFSSYADAVKYAAGNAKDPDSRGLCGTSYVGQVITVFENDTVTAYMIKADRSLQALATTASTGDIAGDLTSVTDRVAALETAVGDGGSIDTRIAEAVKAETDRAEQAESDLSDAIDKKATKATTLAGYGIEDAYTKTEIDGKLSGALHFKGTKTYTSDLPTVGQVQGDVWTVTYNCEQDKYAAGNTPVANIEYVWNGTEWEELGTIHDLSAYETIANNDTKLAGKSNVGHKHVAADVTDFGTAVAAEMKIATDKLDGIEDGAQVNVIETVKVNGVAQDVGEDKSVNITVPTGALAGKDEVAESDLATTLVTKLNNKADKATTLAGYGIEDAMTATDIASAVSTAKSEAITTSGTNADTKIKTAVGELKIDETSYATVKDYVDAKAAAAQTAATYDDSGVKADIKANAEAIGAINHETTGILAKANKHADDGIDAAQSAVEDQISDLKGGSTKTVKEVENAATAAQATADAAVVANAAITAATHTKITYDAKGLVTGGTDLAEADIPTLHIAKIDGLSDALDAKQDNLVMEGTYNESTNKIATESTVKNAVNAEAEIARAAEKANADNIATLMGASNVAGSVAEAKAAADAAQGAVDTLSGKVGTVPTGKTVVDMIADAEKAAKDAASSANSELATKVDTNTGNITTLMASDTTDGSVAKSIKDAISAEDTAIKGTDKDAASAATIAGAKKFASDAVTTLDNSLAAVAKSGDAADVAVADAENKFTGTSVEAVLTELAGMIETANTAGVVTMSESGTTDDVAKAYTFTQNGKTIGTVNIPKDMVLDAGEVVTLTEADEAGHKAGTYMKLVIANKAKSELWIPVDSLIEYVTGAATAEITVSVDPVTHVATATLNDGSITKAKLDTGVQASLGKADSAVQKVTILGHELSNGGAVTVEQAKTDLGLGTAAYTDSDAYDVAGAAAEAKADVIGTDGDASSADTVHGAKKTATELNAAMDTRVAALETAVGEGGSVSTQITEAINKLDKDDTAVSGKYVSAVSEENGVITVTRESLPDYSKTYETIDNVATAKSEAISTAKGYTDDAKTALIGDSANDTKESATISGAKAFATDAADTALASAKTYTDTALTWVEF